MSVTVADPDWDWLDRAIVVAWRELHERRCPKCGRPIAVHLDDSIDDYLVASVTCTAALSLERWTHWWRVASTKLPGAARRLAVQEKALRKAGRDPDYARDWVTYTEAEGPPTY